MTDCETDDGTDGEPTEIYGFELPDGTEEQTERDGLLSNFREWHGLILGILFGLTGHLELIIIFTAFIAGESEAFREVGHFRDAARQPAYSVAGLLLGLLIHVTLWAAIIDEFVML